MNETPRRGSSIEDFIPEGAECGASLALLNEGRLVFAIAGTKFKCPPGELFYMGIGGHRLDGEDLPDCAIREAREELGASVDLVDSEETWLISANHEASRLELSDQVRPLSLFLMKTKDRTDNDSGTYYIAIYQASLQEMPSLLQEDEVRAVIALTPS